MSPTTHLHFVLLLFTFCCLVKISSTSSSDNWELVLLHTNDVHARVEETSVHSGKCSETHRRRGRRRSSIGPSDIGSNSGSKSSGGKEGISGCFAGVARRATLVKRIRAAERHVLLLDAGDQFQGTVWFNYYKGAEAAHFMNKLRYDAMCFGNHEFDNGIEGLMRPFLEEIQCPIVGSNLRTDASLSSSFGTAFLPFKILQVGGERVGIVGYTSAETPALSKPGPHVSFLEEVSSLQLQVDKLLTLGVNKIIALGHSGFTMDKIIARKVKGVDVVIGGHTNTFLYTGTHPSTEQPAGPYPFIVRSDDNRDVPVVQAYAFGKYLGNLRVTFDPAGNVVSSSGNPILLDGNVEQDPDFLSEVEEWKKNLANYSSQVVGKTLVFLNGTTQECRFRECNLGNLICDAMLDNYMRSSDDLQWNHVSACLYNGGGVRTSIDEKTRNGSITYEDLLAVMPFGGTVDLVQLRGSTIKKAFEHSVRRYGQSTGEFLQVAGFRVEFDLSRPPGDRVKTLNILCTNCRVPEYVPVEQEVVYRVVIPSYMYSGGDGFSVIPNETIKHDSGDLDVKVLQDFITKRQTVYPAVEGRIKLYNSAPSSSSLTAPFISMALGVLLWTQLFLF